MKFEKKIVGTLNKCYSIAAMQRNGKPHFLIAAEKHDPCYLFDETGRQLETVWQSPGGVMSMVQVPGADDQFLATHMFFSPNDSAQAKIVVATRKAANDWDIRTLVDAPFVHRFGLLERDGMQYLLVCCLKSGHAYKDDWTMPGKVFAAKLPADLSRYDENHPLPLMLLKDQMCHNHGFSLYSDHGVNTGIVTSDEGVFQFFPPEKPDGDWEIRQLYDQPVSDAVLCDFDGDGQPELGCISPFHGDQLYICHKDESGNYKKVWQFENPAEMLHATWACELCGKPVWIVGWRKGERDLILVSFADGAYKTTRIDHDRGPANAMKFTASDQTEYIVVTNRETDEIAMYAVTQ